MKSLKNETSITIILRHATNIKIMRVTFYTLQVNNFNKMKKLHMHHGHHIIYQQVGRL